MSKKKSLSGTTIPKSLEPLAREARLVSRYFKNPEEGRKHFVSNVIEKQKIFKEMSEKHAQSFVHFGYGLEYNPYHHGLNLTDRQQLRDFYDHVVKGNKSKAKQKKPKKRTKKTKTKIPVGLTLQKELDRQGGQMHFRTNNKKPKALSAKKTKRMVKKGSDNLMTFGVKLPSVKTLEDTMK